MRCLVLILLMMIFTGCGTQPHVDNKPNDAYSVVDDYGNVLQFDAKPKRIYAGTLSIEELLVDLVSADRFVAISEDALDGNISLIKEQATHINHPLSNLESKSITNLKVSAKAYITRGHM